MIALILLLFAFTALSSAFDDDKDWKTAFPDDDEDDHNSCDAGSSTPKPKPCPAKPTEAYDYAVVGQGAGGIMTEYFLAQALKKAGRPVSIVAFEARSEVGGVIRAAKLVKPAGYDGSFGTDLFGDEGPQRTTQISLGMKRRMIAELGLNLLFTPFKGEENARGRRLRCADPTQHALANRADSATDGSSPSLDGNAFVYGSLCLQDEYYVGNASNTDWAIFAGLHNPLVGTNDAPSDNAYFWLLENSTYKIVQDEPDLTHNGTTDNYSFGCLGSTDPVTGETCCVPGTGVQTDRPCPYSVPSHDDVRTHVARQLSFNTPSHPQPGWPVLNYNYSTFLMVDNVGFLGDYRRQFGEHSYFDYQIREYGQTNGIAGYIPGGERRFARTMWRNATQNGVKTYLKERVRKIDILSSSPYKFRIETNQRIVLVKKHLFLNLPPFYLFKHDNSTHFPWAGRLLNGTLIDALRQQEELKHPDPQDVVRVLAQWPPGKPAWFWTLYDNVNGNHSYRQMGDTGCFSRTEFIDTPYHRCTNHIVPVYTDDECERIWLGYFEEYRRTGDNATLVRRIVDEMKTSFPELAQNITDPVYVDFEYFPSAWHWGKRPYDNIENYQVTRKAADPLSGLSVSLIAEAYAISWQGWQEAPARLAKRALLRHAAETSDVAVRNAIRARFEQLFNVFRDASDGNSVSDASYFSNFAYTPPLYTNPNASFMLANERWWPYGPYTAAKFQAPGGFCKASNYGLTPFTE